MEAAPLSSILLAWAFPPVAVIGIPLAATIYVRGWRRPPANQASRPRRWRIVAFCGGLVALALALMSPVSTLGSLLFTAHMIQHMLLAIVAAPLLVLGAVGGTLMRGLPLSMRGNIVRAFRPGRPLRRLTDFLTRPLVAAGLHAVTIWFWHLPVFYEQSVRVDLVHYVQHITIFVTAMLFWWPVASRQLQPGVALIYLTAGMVGQHKLVGAFLTFARQPLYPYYTEVPRLWGFSVLDDQQTAGLIMSTGGFFIVWIAFTTVFVVWAREAGRDEARMRHRQSLHQRAATAPAPVDRQASHAPLSGVAANGSSPTREVVTS